MYGLFLLASLFHSLQPRPCDWARIQMELKTGERKELRRMDEAIEPGGNLFDYRCRSRRFRLTGAHFWQWPQRHLVAMGCGEEERECCVISYASFNHRFPDGMQLLQAQLAKVGFRGHFLYYIGGWPNWEEGSLSLVHVPYAFKPCLFREAVRLGYRKILWLDASVRPLRPLEEVFAKIEQQGYFFCLSGDSIAPYCNKEAIEWFGLSVEEARGVRPLAACLVGLNAAHPAGAAAIERWMEAARGETGFFSPRPDQNALSIIAHQMGLQRFEPAETLSIGSTSEKTRFLIDYPSVR